MLIKNPRFYLIFLVAFIEMHLVGTAAEGLPYIVNAAIVFTVVLITMLLHNKWFFEKKFKATTNEIGFKTTSFKKIAPGIIISIVLLLMFLVRQNRRPGTNYESPYMLENNSTFC